MQKAKTCKVVNTRKIYKKTFSTIFEYASQYEIQKKAENKEFDIKQHAKRYPFLVFGERKIANFKEVLALHITNIN